MRLAFALKDRSDQELLTGLAVAVGHEREDLALVIAHLVEMESRQLALPESCSSLSKYCIEFLHMSDWQAYRRVDVARVALKFPLVLDMLAEGLVNVTAVLRLGPSLTEENHRELLQEATHKTRDEVEEIVARLRPKSPVSDMIRKLPVRSRAAAASSNDGSSGLPNEATLGQNAPESLSDNSQVATEGGVPESVSPKLDHEPALHVQPRASHKPAVSPLAPEIYKFQFTGSARLKKKFKQLQELMRHRVPNGDLATLFEMGVDLLLEEVSREKFGKSDRPRKKRIKADSAEESKSGNSKKTDHSRHIPNHVKREVWSRDEGQCAFVSKSGRRCSERGRIEFHHVVPFAWGGEATAQNIQLRCRAHNAYEGEVIFGKIVRKNGGNNGRVAATGPRTSSRNGNGHQEGHPNRGSERNGSGSP